MTKRRNVIVHIATSADGYIARPDGDLEWLTSRPAPEGFYGMNAFMRSIDTMLLGRKTYEVSLRMGAKFDSKCASPSMLLHQPLGNVAELSRKASMDKQNMHCGEASREWSHSVMSLF
jgi:dihydrofolate reductase